MNPFRIAILLISVSSAANCCECADPGPACQAFNAPYPQAVFVGRVENIVRGPQENLVALEVSESFHPDVHGKVFVRTPSSGASCGYHFEEGQDYLVWATAKEVSDLQVSLCSATQRLEKASSDLEYLRTRSSRDASSWIFGEAWQYTYDPQFQLPNPELPRPTDRPEPERSMKPLVNVSVISSDANGRIYEAPVDAQGEYKFLGLPPGKYSVRLAAPNTMLAWPQQTELDLKPRGCGEVDFRAQIDGRVSGLVTDEQNEPEHRIQVQLVDSFVREGVDRWSERLFNADTDENGRFEFKGVPAGEYLLLVSRPPKGPPDFRVFPDITYYPRTRDAKAATVIKLSEAQKLTGMNIKMLPPRQPLR
jgi:hypothetical protein